MSEVCLPPGVVVLERGWLSANNVIFAGAGPATVVDTGYATHSAQTLQLIDTALAGKPLEQLLNTHLHSDHCGGNAALQSKYPGLRTLIPPGQAQHVRQWDPVALTYVPTGQQCPRFSADGVLIAGQDMELAGRSWRVHAAPGHDPHSVILFEPQSQTLISADALWESGFGVVFPELEGEHAFAEVAATLDLIEALDPAIVIPGHGRIFTQVQRSLDVARQRLRGFVSDPQKHARHAAKVLLKFKLLELHTVDLQDFARWASATPYFRAVHQRWFADVDVADWIGQLSADLVRSGAARQNGLTLENA